ncbi:MAG TPA: tetratricopeptide repeat protein [Vicinamibacterales bacterium]|nr:tetratricopeptide repeat protein [Vicinamibacterales bacterium]
MRRVSSRASLGVLIAAFGLLAAGCGQFGLLKGKMAFKDANTFYQQQDYKSAAEKYEETLAACKGSEDTCTDARLTSAYFFLGNSYDNQYRPARKGEQSNDDMLTKAIENYKKSAEIEQSRPDIKKLALEYLVAAYGPDKLNDPSQAEPILRRMIELEPNEPSNYTYLSRIYEENGEYDQAEQLLQKAREMKPNDASVYVSLALFYNRQGEFDKTMEALHSRAEKEPSNPEAFYTIATYYWDKANRDFTTPEPDKIKFVSSGLQAVDKAIELKPEYPEALTYKGLLLRTQALLEKNPKKQQALIKEADQYRDRAVAIQAKQRAAGASATK